MSIQVQWAPKFHNNFWQKKLFLFFKNNFTKINHCKFIHHKSHLKPFFSYLPCIERREYYSIIFNVKKCTIYSIKYGNILTTRCHKVKVNFGILTTVYIFQSVLFHTCQPGSLYQIRTTGPQFAPFWVLVFWRAFYTALSQPLPV